MLKVHRESATIAGLPVPVAGQIRCAGDCAQRAGHAGMDRQTQELRHDHYGRANNPGSKDTTEDRSQHL